MWSEHHLSVLWLLGIIKNHTEQNPESYEPHGTSRTVRRKRAMFFKTVETVDYDFWQKMTMTHPGSVDLMPKNLQTWKQYHACKVGGGEYGFNILDVSGEEEQYVDEGYCVTIYKTGAAARGYLCCDVFYCECLHTAPGLVVVYRVKGICSLYY